MDKDEVVYNTYEDYALRTVDWKAVRRAVTQVECNVLGGCAARAHIVTILRELEKRANE